MPLQYIREDLHDHMARRYIYIYDTYVLDRLYTYLDTVCTIDYVYTFICFPHSPNGGITVQIRTWNLEDWSYSFLLSVWYGTSVCTSSTCKARIHVYIWTVKAAIGSFEMRAIQIIDACKYVPACVLLKTCSYGRLVFLFLIASWKAFFKSCLVDGGLEE